MCLLCQILGINQHQGEEDAEMKKALEIKKELHKLLNDIPHYLAVNIGINLLAELTVMHNAPIFTVSEAFHKALEFKTREHISELLEKNKTPEEKEADEKKKNEGSTDILDSLNTEDLKVV